MGRELNLRYEDHFDELMVEKWILLEVERNFVDAVILIERNYFVYV